MDKPLFFLGLTASAVGALVLFVIIPAQHIPPIMSTVSPDFYPNIGTVIFLIGGIGLTVSALYGPGKNADIGRIARTVKFSSLMAILFSITLAAFYWTHFIVGGIILVAAFMILLGERRVHYVLLVSTIAPVVIWLFIDVLLGRSLP